MANDSKGAGVSGEREIEPTDPCASQRDNLADLDRQIRSTLEDISSGDFGANDVARKRRELEALHLRRPGLVLALTNCEAQHPAPSA